MNSKGHESDSSIEADAKFILMKRFIFPMLLIMPRADAQSLTMDGESGIFLQPVAELVPSPQNKFGGPTLSLHAVGAALSRETTSTSGVEEGFGNWLEFGFTHSPAHEWRRSDD